MPPRVTRAAAAASTATPSLPATLPLDGCVVAFSGNFAAIKQVDLIAQAKRLGARAPKSLTKDATHLITTRTEFNDSSSKVREARNRGLYIVDIEWMLDSEKSNSRASETIYTFDTTTNNNGSGPAATSAQPLPTTSKKRQASPTIIDSSSVSNPPPKKAKLELANKDGKIPVLGENQIATSRDIQVPVDECCPLTGYRVHIDEDNVIWDASLNQTNAGRNNNKFYKIQLLVDAAKNYKTWTRWGRVGEQGQNSIQGTGSLTDAKRYFEKKFKDKTGLKWNHRMENPRPDKYVFLEKCYEPDSDDEDNKPAGPANDEHTKKVEKEEEPVCTLHPEIQQVMEVIFNRTFFAASMAEMNYDVAKLPLGKLSKATIMRGFQALKDLSDAIESPTGPNSIESLSNLYYSLIPHNFQRNRPPVIRHQANVKRELELLENLADMKEAANIMKEEIEERNNGMHPLDRHYMGLGLTEMTPLDPASVEFQLLGEYLMETRGLTHCVNYSIESIFRIERPGEKERFVKNENSDRRLLWHGSRATNYGGILSQGLRIAPPEAPATGYMFAKGVYLADVSTKSANYCHSDISGGTALLLLCEAELGRPMQELTHADSHADKKARAMGASSTWGQGIRGPSAWKDASCVHPSLEGVIMPDTKLGSVDVTGVPGAYLQYNEYICYDVAQVRLRYLLKVKI
ncbi:Poly [ADP-ribose] polymerase 2 [Cytospora mali]|uniref:Poly [ADP-ribose] polymerase n=1 Tax=Cytospora mali TaxID=578113 RepID=A0A194V741_CYTMA|nr:Poly [ADP-ribose] polymerase 2 [Valsa mali var. pyri (nom. inval.)]